MAKKNILSILKKWVEINSYSRNYTGLSHMLKALKTQFSTLDAQLTEYPLSSPEGPSTLLVLEKRKKARNQVLFGGHYDTVFPLDSPFQSMNLLSSSKVSGPGVLDMKSGLLMIWMILTRIEESPWKTNMGWKVILNPDEEIGSLYSKELIHKEAKGYDFALWFEPALNQKTLIHKRAASLNFEMKIKGKSAHVGRAFDKGRSAINGLILFLHELRKRQNKNLLINVGEIQGGNGFNTVADWAKAKINIRAFSDRALVKFEESVEKQGKERGETMGLSFSFKRFSLRPAKPLTSANRKLFQEYIDFARTEGFVFETKESFGVTDSASLGELPCIDTLGAVGDHLHTEAEWADLNSLFDRSELTYRFLEERMAS